MGRGREDATSSFATYARTLFTARTRSVAASTRGRAFARRDAVCGRSAPPRLSRIDTETDIFGALLSAETSWSCPLSLPQFNSILDPPGPAGLGDRARASLYKLATRSTYGTAVRTGTVVQAGTYGTYGTVGTYGTYAARVCRSVM